MNSVQDSEHVILQQWTNPVKSYYRYFSLLDLFSALTWLGERKGNQPVNNLALANPKGSSE